MRPPAVLVLRAAEDAPPLESALEQAGMEPLRLPLLAFEPGGDAEAFSRALRESGTDWVFVTSRRAVPAVAAARPFQARVAAVGPGTAAALEAAGVKVDILAEGVGAPALLGAFAAAVGTAERAGVQRILWPTSDQALSLPSRLPDELAAMGHELLAFEAYRTRLLKPAREVFEEALARAAAAIFTSPSTVRALREAAEAHGLTESCLSLPAVCFGGRTERALNAAGFRRIIATGDATPASLVEALKAEIVP